MSQYNPYFVADPTSDPELAFLGLPKRSGEIKPIQYFGRYNFSTPQAAANFIQTPQFTGLWDRNNVGLQNIGVRAELNDSGRYNSPSLNWTYEKEMQHNRDVLARRLANPKIDPAVAQRAFENSSLASRAAGRFYTQQGLPNSASNTAFYLNSANTQLDSGSVPVRVIADPRLSRFAISDRIPFNGNIPEYPEQLSVQEALQKNRNTNLSRVVGKDLGASLSSNPKGEAFVSSQMASKESRYAGRVNADGTVTLMGSPKTSVALQRVGNALQGTGTFMNYAGVIPIVTSELRRAKADYENPVTQEVYKKEDVVDLDGRKYTKESVSDMARMHPMNAKNHPEITDDMRYAYHPAWFDEDPAITRKKNEEKWRKETGARRPIPMDTPSPRE